MSLMACSRLVFTRPLLVKGSCWAFLPLTFPKKCSTEADVLCRPEARLEARTLPGPPWRPPRVLRRVVKLNKALSPSQLMTWQSPECKDRAHRWAWERVVGGSISPKRATPSLGGPHELKY